MFPTLLRLMIVMLVLPALLCPPLGSAQERRTVVGIMPVYDAAAYPWGEEFARQLTYMLFRDLQGVTGLEPLLLNPGGLYNPLSDEWTLEYAREAHADLVLVTTVLAPDRPKNGDPVLRLSHRLVSVSSGSSTPEGMLRVAIWKADFLAGLDYGHSGWFSAGGSRPFEKQPFGKAARSMAQQLVAHVRQNVSGAPATGTAPLWSKGSCDVSFVVVFPSKNVRSKAFSVIINDREETLSMSDGVVHPRLSSGPVLVRVAVRDAPYKTPVQSLYQANTYLDCSAQQQSLTLEIEAVGQAFLRWR